MRKSLIYSSMLLVLILFGFGLIQQANSQSENLKVTNYSWYINSAGGFNVAGEVQNVGPTILNPVVIGGIVYTPDGVEQIRSNPCIVYVNYMLPQQKAPFLMEFPIRDLSWLSQGVDHIDFQTVKADANDTYQYQDLSVTSSKLFTDAEGVYWVTGTVQNTGTKTATNVRVNAAFYNASGTVVAVGYSDPPSNLSPSGSASFKAGAFDVNKTESPPDRQISSYTLWVYAGGPLLTGTPPPPSNSSSGSISPSTSSTDSGSNNSGSNDNSSNPAAPGINYIAIIVIVVVIIGVLLVFNRRKSSKTSTEKNTKSQALGKRKQSPRNRYRDV